MGKGVTFLEVNYKWRKVRLQINKIPSAGANLSVSSRRGLSQTTIPAILYCSFCFNPRSVISLNATIFYVDARLELMSVGDNDFSLPATAIKLVLTIHPPTYRGLGILTALFQIAIVRILNFNHNSNPVFCPYQDIAISQPGLCVGLNVPVVLMLQHHLETLHKIVSASPHPTLSPH